MLLGLTDLKLEEKMLFGSPDPPLMFPGGDPPKLSMFTNVFVETDGMELNTKSVVIGQDICEVAAQARVR